MSRFFSILLTLILIGLVGGAITFRTLIHMMDRAGPLTQEHIVLIDRGMGMSHIAARLAQQGIIDNHWLFIISARFQEKSAKLKAGEYAFPARISINAALDKMVRGDVYKRQITIPEGLRSADIVALLNNHEALSGSIDTIPDEGSLMPDSYAYIRGDSAQTLIDRMQQSMQNHLQKIWEQRSDSLPFTTPEEALILASIIEKETGVAQERQKVAGVFVNRLRIDMPLQTDPTVIYAIVLRDGQMNRPLLRKDLRDVESPYNTYRNKGLPPGPIANPGKEALLAAVNPQDHDYLFFVADGSGGHAFAKTLNEHNRNVAQWRAIQRSN